MNNLGNMYVQLNWKLIYNYRLLIYNDRYYMDMLNKKITITGTTCSHFDSLFLQNEESNQTHFSPLLRLTRRYSLVDA